MLRVRDLAVSFTTDAGRVQVVRGIDLDVEAGAFVALVGESGCGKSVTAQTLLRLLPTPPAWLDGGSVHWQGRDLLALERRELERVRGGAIAMVFQNPQGSLNPVLSVGKQLGEALKLHRGLAGAAARREAEALLEQVHVDDPPRRLDSYPHQLSGGQAQRVMIAAALAGEPSLLIADEPTTALDVTTGARVLELLGELRRRRGMAVLLISHNLAQVAAHAERVHVMYAGRIVESGPTEKLFRSPTHPYTRGLIASIPTLDATPEMRTAPLRAIPGQPPLPQALPPGCAFAPRCALARDDCRQTDPPPRRFGAGEVRCLRAGELATESG